MSETPAADKNVGSLPELTASKSWSTSSIDKTLETENTEVDSEEDMNIGVIENTEDVAIQIISTYDDPTLPSITFRSIFLGVGLSAFSSVLATIYTFKPQNASVSQLFCLIIAYVLGTAMHSVIPSHGVWRYLNPCPFNLNSFYPNYISGVNLLQSLDWRGTLNAKKRRFFWIVFAAIFWEWIPQYPMPILTTISVICLADNGRSSNEGIGLLSVSTSWTLITQGTPLVWPLQTQINSFIGMWLGYIVLTTCYYSNVFNGRDLPFMSTSLFSETGDTYNQSEVITVDYKLNTGNRSQDSRTASVLDNIRHKSLCYNLSLGAAVTYLFLWHWPELRSAFGGLRFLKRGHAEVDDPHYKEMQKYPLRRVARPCSAHRTSARKFRREASATDMPTDTARTPPELRAVEHGWRDRISE
ncbi:OPT oligopeptide transporter protein-domain-containing protein [Mycena olivaceomarginata]|nr:OPT oligopeptide transporter protein-domain-containing protein [Mycena olivaceomarginata]